MDPELEGWCRKLVAFCSRVNVALGEAQRRAGADGSAIGLAGTSLISPSLFDAFELPGAQAFCKALQRTGGFAFVHACGDETQLLENLLATGADCLELDPGTDAAACKRAVEGRSSVLGMIDPTQVMHLGTPEAVRQHARRMLAVMGPGGGFIIGPGCALPADTPEENVQALMECVRCDGRYGADGRPLAI
jgi:uroporphyrinogen decarboxylase